MAGRRYSIVGDGAAGMTAAQALRRLDPAASITVVADDPHPTYFRAALTNYLLGELRDEQIWAVPPSLYRDLRVERIFARVASVDAAGSQLRLTSGATLPYESLLVASGARARLPAFAGADLDGVVTLRTLQDARAVLDAIALDGLRRAVVIGGGPLALEWAHAMRERGVAVTLLVRDGRLMAGALDATASDLVLARLRMGGIEVLAGDEVEAALPGSAGRVGSLRTRAGRSLPCELCAVAIGVVCNTELLAGSGVALGARGGVRVDDRLRSSVAGVFAAGDVAEVGGRLLQLWEPAQRAAQVAAENMAGGDAVYAPGTHYFATRLYDLDFASVGVVEGPEGSESLVGNPRRTGLIAYRKLVLEGGRLVGALMLGARDAEVRRRGRLYKRLIDAGTDVTAIRGDLLDPAFDLLGWLETRAMVEKPPPAREAGPSPAQVRGTQRLSLGTRVAGPLPVRSGDAADPPRTVPAAPMLSIGLRLPFGPGLTAPGPLAFLESPSGRFPLERTTVGIGRLATAHVVLSDVQVSSLHAQLTEDDGWFLRDAGSRNGTFVNGAMVTNPHPLADGDRIRVGGTELVFRGGAPAPAPPHRATPRPAGAPAGAVARAVLEIRGGPGLGLRFVLADVQLTAGRDPANAVRLDDRSVSRRHAIFSASDGRWFVSDLHSRHGTRRNGALLVAGEESPLEDGDTLTLGDVVLAFSAR